jgi:hypothetical protein
MASGAWRVIIRPWTTTPHSESREQVLVVDDDDDIRELLR